MIQPLILSSSSSFSSILVPHNLGYGLERISYRMIILSNHYSLRTPGSENMEEIHTRKRIRRFHIYLESLHKLLLRVDASRKYSSKMVLPWDINTHFQSFVFLTACHVVPLHFTNYTDGRHDNSWQGIETHGITYVRDTNMLWLHQSNLYHSRKHNKVSKFQIQTTNIKHSTRYRNNAQRNIADSQLIGRKVQPALIPLM